MIIEDVIEVADFVVNFGDSLNAEVDEVFSDFFYFGDSNVGTVNIFYPVVGDANEEDFTVVVYAPDGSVL